VTPGGTFDDVAAAAACGAAPLVIALAAGPGAVSALDDWLERAVPAFGPYDVERVVADDLLARLEQEEGPLERVLVVPDAADADDAGIVARWAAWDLARERLVGPIGRGAARSVVLLASTTAGEILAPAAPHLLAVAAVLTVAADPARPATDVVAAAAAAVAELEERYGRKTEQVIATLLSGDAPGLPEHDLARWRAASATLAWGAR
jgi:hypothetical protein